MPAAYARCKPLAPMTRGIAMQAVARNGGLGGDVANLHPTPEDGLGDDTLRVFYGNDAYYVLFRLHQYLYDRRGTLAPALHLHPAPLSNLAASAAVKMKPSISLLKLSPPTQVHSAHETRALTVHCVLIRESDAPAGCVWRTPARCGSRCSSRRA